MKKAQTEIIGLLVIVILFIFVGLIYIMFAGQGDQESLTRDVTQSVKVKNMLDAFVQVTPDYTKIPYDQMGTIIKDCYTSEEMVGGEDCKQFITETLDKMIKAYKSKQKYEFDILNPGGTPISGFHMGSPCEGDAKVATERVLVGGQVLKLKLTYCG